MRKLLARLFQRRPKPLVSADGAFTCTPDHAVELAYMLSTAEAYVNEMEPSGYKSDDGRVFMRRKNLHARHEVAEIIGEYLEGNMSPEEVREAILEDTLEDT